MILYKDKNCCHRFSKKTQNIKQEKHKELKKRAATEQQQLSKAIYTMGIVVLIAITLRSFQKASITKTEFGDIPITLRPRRERKSCVMISRLLVNLLLREG